MRFTFGAAFEMKATYEAAEASKKPLSFDWGSGGITNAVTVIDVVESGDIILVTVEGDIPEDMAQLIANPGPAVQAL